MCGSSAAAALGGVWDDTRADSPHPTTEYESSIPTTATKHRERRPVAKGNVLRGRRFDEAAGVVAAAPTVGTGINYRSPYAVAAPGMSGAQRLAIDPRGMIVVRPRVTVA
ncbi:hypothetical protein TUM20985_29020 [Mycobacterium antarcticum]|nr:hypothetical protein TUM20985_29020 [Mycolicibacterium sp. TUM20985]GLP84102.1 hypothetical protein TUM20984_55220 [Mycolicibacterium sp. TUM20984]